MATTTTKTNKPILPRGVDNRPVDSYNRAKLFSGKALDFDGVNDLIKTPNMALMSTNVWTYSSSVKIDTGLILAWYIFDTRASEAAGHGAHFTSEDKLQIFQVGDSSRKSDFIFERNQWYKIDITSDASNVKLYINGVLSQSFSPFTAVSISGDLTIGARFTNDYSLAGNMGGFKAFDIALTAAQVADLYNNPEKVVPTGVANTALKLWLPMQEGAGTTAYDGSGNGNHGTISGATYVHGIGAPVSQTAVIDWNKGSNLVLQSNDFTTSWTGNSVSLTTGQLGPTGINDAWKIEKVAAYGNIVQGISVNNASTYTFSIIAKAGNTDFVSIRFSTGGGYDYRHKIDLTDGATSTASGDDSSGVVYKTQNLGDGWWRFGIVCTTNSTTAFVNAYAGDTADASGYVYIAHAHVQETNELKPYVRTYASTLSNILLPQGLTTGRDITGVNLFENVRKQGALNLDGNSWAEVHDNASLDFGTGSFSLEAWAKVKFVDQGSSVNVILNLGNEINSADSAGLAMSNVLAANFWYSSPSGSSVLTQGDWVHIIGVYDETNATLYVNGLQVDQDARNAKNINNALVKRIGRDVGVARFYHDQIAQPRIYNRALTASEVLNNYNATSSLYI